MAERNAQELYVGRKFKTVPVPGKTPREVDLKTVEKMLDVSRIVSERGWAVENAGNVSVRRPDCRMWITMGGVGKGEIKPEGVVEVRDVKHEDSGSVTYVNAGKLADGRVIEPSSESLMHWLVYKARPKNNAVIHVHDDVARVAAEEGLLKVPLTGETSYGTFDQARQVAELMKDSDYVVIRGHGVVASGRDLSDVLRKIVVMHEKAKRLTKV